MIFAKIIGFIIYQKIIKNGDKEYSYDYVARCECDNGDVYKFNGNKVNDSKLRSKYYIPSITELHLNQRKEIV